MKHNHLDEFGYESSIPEISRLGAQEAQRRQAALDSLANLEHERKKADGELQFRTELSDRAHSIAMHESDYYYERMGPSTAARVYKNVYDDTFQWGLSNHKLPKI